MCYDIAFQVAMRQFSDYFPELIYDSQTAMNFEAYDHVQGVILHKDHPIIYTNREDFKLHCRLMSWGIVPHYETKIPASNTRTGWLNIRSERILADKKTYWNKIRNRRCLIPVSGIYEHRKVPKQKNKVPYLVKPKEQEIFFLPGLYSVSKIFDHEMDEWYEYWTFAMITRAANSLMAQIHNDGDNAGRMPLFLPFNLSKRWLEEDLSDQPNEYQAILEYEMPSEELEYKTVWTIRTGKARPDGKMFKDEEFVWEGVGELTY